MGDGRSSAERALSPVSTLPTGPSTDPPAVHYDDEELPARTLTGPTGVAVAVVAFLVALLALWQVFRPLAQGSQYYLIIFLAGTLPLIFLSYHSGFGRKRDRPTVADWILAVGALLVCLYPVNPFTGGYDAFLNRQGLLEPIDVVFGAVLLVLTVEACRRTTGWALPIVCLAFLAYAYYGGLLPQDWPVAHVGLDFAQIVDALYNSGSGFYGTPLDVAATYIVLFTIYGAVLDLSGASRFFVDLSVAAFRKSRSAAGSIPPKKRHSTTCRCRGSSRWSASSSASSASVSSALTHTPSVSVVRAHPPPRFAARRERAWSTSTCRIAYAAMASRCARSAARGALPASLRYASWTSVVALSERVPRSRASWRRARRRRSS
jgi:hypothetical protein